MKFFTKARIFHARRKVDEKNIPPKRKRKQPLPPIKKGHNTEKYQMGGLTLAELHARKLTEIHKGTVLTKTLKDHGFEEIEIRGEKQYTKKISIKETLKIKLSKNETDIDRIWMKKKNNAVLTIEKSNFKFFCKTKPELEEIFKDIIF